MSRNYEEMSTARSVKSHRQHMMRSFTEEVALGDFAGSGAPTMQVEGVYYAKEKVLWRCDADLTNHAIIYTWAAETAGISGIAFDYTNERIILMGHGTETIHSIDYDGSNPADLHTTISGVSYNSKIRVDDDNARLVWGVNVNQGIKKCDLDGSNPGDVTASGVVGALDVDAINDRYYSSRQAATKEWWKCDRDGSGYALLLTTGLNTLDDVVFDPFSGRVYGVVSNGLTFKRIYFTDKDGSPRANFCLADGSPLTTWTDMAVDPVNDNIYAIGFHTSDATKSGLYLFTDADQPTTAHGDDCDYSLGTCDKTKNRAIALRFTQSLQSGTYPVEVSGTAQLQGTIPDDALVVRIYVDVMEGFQGDTAALLVIGDDNNENRYVEASIDVKTVGIKATGKPSGPKFHKEKKNPKLKLTAGNSFGNLTGGRMRVTVVYVEP